MKRFRPMVLLVSALALMLVLGGPATGGSSRMAEQERFTTVESPGAPSRYRPGEVIVKFKRGVGAGRERAIKRSADVSDTVRDLAPKSSTGKVQLLKLEPGISVEDAVNRLKANPEVACAEPNYRIRASYTPADPGYPNQWGLNNTGQTIQGTPGTPGADIDAQNAWDLEKGNSNPVTVAVIDTGADLGHPELASKLATGYNWAGISQLSDSRWNGSGWVYSAATFGTDGDHQYYAQSITGTGGTLDHVGVELMKVNNPGDITVMVKNNLGDADPGIASFNISAAEVGIAPPPTEIYKALAPVTLTAGQTYYLVFKTIGVSGANYYLLFCNDAASSGTYDWYREGDMWMQTGGLWSSLSPGDTYFRTNANAVPHDDDGHGTHTSGIAGAIQGNNQGGVGVSFGANVMPLKVLDSSGSGYVSDSTAAIYHAADNGAKVINMSFGGYDFVQAEQDACSYAYGKGVVLFASAGNDGDSTMNYPAGYSNVIGVGATTNRDARSSFSSYNSSVDVTAPGQGIYSTMPTYAVGMTSEGYPLNYSNMSGTSMASPMAAGVGALVRSKSPTMTPLQVEQRIENNADDLGSPGRDDYFGFGRVNAYRALGGTVPPTISSITPASGTAGTRVTVKGTDFGRIQGSSYVTFNGGRATDYTAWSNQSVEVRVPAGATTGPLKVTNPGGASNGVTFTVTPMTFYFAEGTTRPNFDTYLCIQNPCSLNTNAKIIYMKGDGKTVEDQVPVPKNSRVTVSVKDRLGVGDDRAHDFSVRIQATNTAQIICEWPMYFNYNGVWTGGHDVVGASSPAKTFYFAEGTCRPNFDSYICIQNPNKSDASVKITYMKGDGRTVEDTVPAPGNSRTTVSVKDKLGVGDDRAHDFSARVESVSGPRIIAERPMYFNYQGYTALNWTGGHDVVGALAPAKTFYFAEGSCRPNFDSYICIQNPGAGDASVKITYMKGDGKNIEETLTVPGSSRYTVVVKDRLGEGDDKAHDFSAKVQALGGSRIICERPMYFNYKGVWTGGHDVVGALSPAKTFYFAEGSCRPNFDPYVCVQNPGGSDAKVKITYILGNGKSKEQLLTVPKNSRYTVVVKDRLGVGDDKAHDFSAKVETTNGTQIICERPMYFNYNGAWTGGHDVVGFTQ